MSGFNGGKENLNILIADDDPVVRETFREYLNETPCNIMIATDGEIALETALAVRPNLIFLDVIMPNMDGLTALTHLREKERTREIPIIVVTGKSDAATLVSAIRAGADDFITKPFLRIELLRKMNYVLMDQQEKQAVTEATLPRDISTYTSGKPFETMRGNFILGFETVYIDLIKLASSEDKDGLKELMSRLLDSVKFFDVPGVKEKVLKIIMTMSVDDWEETVTLLEEIYGVFKQLRPA